jgi:hypothetical protein
MPQDDVNPDDQEECKETRPLQTEALEKRRLTGACRQYAFDSKPIMKRLRSQTAIKE